MDPYETPDHSDLDKVSEDPSRHRHYDVILKMVLWDEPKEKIDQRMRVNQVPPAIADQIFVHARNERTRVIRTEYFKRLTFGLALLGGAIATFTGCWFGLNFIPRILLYGCFTATAFGLWKFVDGITGFIMAEKKTGSVADEL